MQTEPSTTTATEPSTTTGRPIALLPRYTSDDIRAHIKEEPTTGRTTLGNRGQQRFNARDPQTSIGQWESAVSSAHRGAPRRRQWRIDSPSMPINALAQFVLRQSPSMTQALDSLRYHARLLKADADKRGEPIDLSGIVDDDGAPSWIADGLHNGRTKIGKVVGRRELGSHIGHDIERLALIAQQVKYLRSCAFVVVASSEPNAFMRLGHTDDVDDGACFRVGGCHASAPIILGASSNSVVYYSKRDDARATIIGRAWGIVGDKGIMWTNGYSIDDAPGGRDTFDILYALVGYLIADDTSALVSGAYIDDDTELMYDNGDGKKIGCAPVLYCESCDYRRGSPCINCGERVDDDDSMCDDNGGTWCQECYCESHVYIESCGEYVHTDSAVCLHDGEYALSDDAVCLHNGEYALADDAVELHDGDYALSDDAVYIEHNDEYALSCDIVGLHDGEYALEDDAVELHDGEYALPDDAVRLHDGEYALEDDAVELSPRYLKRKGIILHDDKAYALEDDAVELHDGEYALADDGDIVELADGESAWRDDTLVGDDGERVIARLFAA